MKRTINAAIHDISEEDYNFRKSVASDPDTDVRTLKKLAEDENPWIRNCVAYNPSTPQDIAEALKKEPLMPKYAIVVTPCDESWVWGNGDWKDYVCADFDENIVITGNRDYQAIEEATWWTEAKSLIDNAFYYDLEDFLEDNDEYAEDKLRDVWDACHNCKDDEDPEFVAEIAMIIYPGLKLEVTDISGYSQGEYVDVVYDTSCNLDVQGLEDWFFGQVEEANVFELHPEDMVMDDLELDDLDTSNISDYGEEIEGWTFVTDSEAWKGINYLAELFGYPVNECILLEE